MALEPRIMYDAAAAATVGAAQTHTDGAPDHAAISAAEQHAPPVTPSNNGTVDPHATQTTQPSLAQAPNVQTAPPPPAAPEAAKTTSALDASPTAAPTGGIHDIVFIDSRVPNLSTLIGGLKPGEMAFVLDADKDGVQQIADILKAGNFHDVSSIQIASHGLEGEVQLGSTVLQDSNLDAYASQLSAIGASLSADGDVLLYGCYVGHGDAGMKFLADLSDKTGADVAASTQAVGDTANGINWTLDASVGKIEAAVPFSVETLENYDGTLATPLTGQLWYATIGASGTGESVVGYINSSDGSNPVINASFPTGAVPYAIGLDLAAGYYFTANTDHLTISSHRISDGAVVDTIQVGDANNPGSADDDLVSALTVDPINHMLYVNRWGETLAETGIVKISYNPLTGDINNNGAYNSGSQQFLIGGTSGIGGGTYVYGSSYEIDLTNHKIYYTDNDDKYAVTPFHATNGIYVVDYQTPAAPTLLTSQTQFPVSETNGTIGGIAVDNAKGLIYFTTFDATNVAAAKLWYMPIAGGTATQILTFKNGNAGAHLGAGLTLDAQNQQLYLTVTDDSTPDGVNANQIVRYQLSSNGQSVTTLATFTFPQLINGTTTNYFAHPTGTEFDNLPTLSVTGTTTHATEQGGYLTLAPGATSSDSDGGYYSGAVVQITGGTFSGGEGSANDDHLSINDTTAGIHRTSGLVSGTNITVAFDAATGKLTLSGYDTIANYNAVLAKVQYNATGEDPTNSGANATRTVSWSVSDGAQGVAFGAQNSATTTLNIDVVNDAPTATAPTAHYSVVEKADLSLRGTGLSVADVDGGSGSETVTLTVGEGTITITAGNSGVTGITNNGTGSVTFTGTIAQINALLNTSTGTILYNDSVSGPVASTSLSLTINDGGNTGGGALTGTASATIDITPLNHPASITGFTLPAAQTEAADASAQDIPAITGTLTVTDADTGDTLSGTVAGNATAKLNGSTTLPAGVDLTALIAAGAISFNTATSNGGSRTLTWTYNPAAANLDFLAQGDVLTIDYTASVTDGHGSYGTQVLAITVNGTNDAPVVVSGATINYTENDPPTVVSPAATVSDADAASFNGGKLTVFFGDGHTDDQLSLVNIGTGAGQIGVSGSAITYGGVAIGSFTGGGNGADLVVTFSSAAATPAAVQALVRDVRYANSSDAPSASVRTISFVVDDGSGAINNTALATATVNITAVNDPAVVSGTITGDVTEAGGVNNGTAGIPTASATLIDTDVDGTANSFIQVTTPTLSANGYGRYTMTAGGTWSYALDDSNATVQALAAGASASDSFTVQTADGTTQVITVTVHGANDAAVISGTATGGVIEAGGVGNNLLGTPTASGVLTDTDIDGATNTFTAAASTLSTGGYGHYTMAAGGTWTYTLDNNNATVQALADSAQLTDTFTVTAADGTAKVITITITGSNDAAVLSSDTVARTETDLASDLNAAGTLTISDVDSPATFVAQTNTVGSYGTFSINAAGGWTYTASSAHNEFAAGSVYNDTFTVKSADDTSTTVTISITGTNDAAVLSSATVARTETNLASDLNASGTLTISDIDSPTTFIAQTNTAGNYGTFSIDAAGAWTYTASSAHDEFVAGSLHTDTFTVKSADNTSTTVTINITGTNDVAVLSSDTVARTEGNLASDISTSGNLTVTDPDTGEQAFVAQTGTAGSFGTFSIGTGGAWTYTANSAHNEFVAGQVYTDTFTVKSIDNTSTTVTINITGTNDAPVVTAPATLPSVAEQTVLNLKTRGFAISDADGGVETVTLSVGEGRLDVTAGGSGVASITGSGTGTVVITGTVAQINALLASDGTSTVSYIDNTDTPGANTTLTLAVKDSSNATGNASVNIDLIAVNDAPSASIAPATSYAAVENIGLGLTGLSIGDVDGGNGSETVTLSVGEGRLNVVDSAGLTGISNSGTSTVTITGKVADIQALLARAGSVTYTENNDHASASTVLTLSVNDNGSTGGGALTASATATIGITATNDAPVAVADSFQVSANPVGSSASLIVPAAFGPLVNDSDPDGNALSIATINGNAVQIGVPIALTYGSLTITVGGGFTYTPTPGGATGTETFSYTATDGTQQSNAVNVTLVVVPATTGAATADTLWTTTVSGANPATAPNSIQDTGILKIGTDGTRTVVFQDSGTTAQGQASPIQAPSNIVVDVANNLYYILARPSTSTGRTTGIVYMGHLNSTAAPTIVYTNPDSDAADGANIDDIAIDPTTHTLYISQRVNWNNGATANNGIFAFSYDTVTGVLGAKNAIVTVDPTYSDTKVGHQISYMTPMPINGVLYYAQVDYTTWVGTYQLHAVTVNGTTHGADTVISTPGWPAVGLNYHDQSGTYISELNYDSGNGQLYVSTYNQNTVSQRVATNLYMVNPAGGTTPSLVTISGPNSTYAYSMTYNSANGHFYMPMTGSDPAYTQSLIEYSVSSDGKTLTYVQSIGLGLQPASAGAAYAASGVPYDQPTGVFYTVGNKPPAATITATTYSATEQTALSLKNTGLSISDVDGGNSTETVVLSVEEGTLNVNVGGSGATLFSGNGTSSVTIKGTLAQINALLNSDASSAVSFTDNNDTPSAHTTLKFVVTDSGGLTATDVATIFITAVNDAPTATITPTSYNATEQTALNLKTGGLSVGDVDSGNGIISVVLSVGDGALTVTAGTSGASVSGSGSSSVTITGTVSQINNLLTTGSSTVSYINNSDTPIASTTLTMTVNDNGNTGSGGAKTASDTATINIGAVNDAPVAREDVYSGNQGVTVNGSSVLANDSDTDTAAASLHASLVGGPAHATSFTLNADGTFTYVPDPTFSGSDYFTYKVIGGGPDSNTVTVTINIASSPIHAKDDSYTGAAGATEDTALAVSAANGVLANDTNEDHIPLAATVVTGPAHGTLTLAADGSFTYTPGANFYGNDSFTYQVSDGTNPPALGTVTIAVAGVNDAPVLSPLAPAAVTYVENAAPTSLFASEAVTDVDNPANFAGGTLTVAFASGNVAGDQFALLGTSGFSVASTGVPGVGTLYDGATAIGTITDTGTSLSVLLNAAATPAVVNRLAASFTFQNTTDDPGATDRVVKLTFNDGGNVGSGLAVDVSVTQTVHVTPVNDAPVVTASAPASYNEQAAPVVLDATITVTDADSTSLTRATVTITDYVAGDTLAAPALAGLTVISNDNGVLVFELTGSTSPADYQAALRQVTFASGSDDPTVGGGHATRSISWVVADNTSVDSTAATTTLTITADNDAPTLTVPGGLRALPGYSVAITDVVFADPDGGALNEQATFSVPNGALSATGGSGVTVSGTATALVLTGSVTDLNAFIAAGHLSFLPQAGALSTTVTVGINDLGHTGASAQTATADFVVAGNSPPTAPADADTGDNTVQEGAAAGTLVGITALSTDPDPGDSVTYSILGRAASAFQIDSATGVISVKDASLIDYESNPSHTTTITVQASDGNGGVVTTDFVLNVSDKAPSVATDANGAEGGSISEGAANGDTVGITAASTDVNSPSSVISYSLSDNAGGRFTIDAVTGVVTVADATLLNYESATSHDITVVASDGTLTSTKIFTIAVTDVAPVTPTDGDVSANAVSEDAAIGTVVGVTALSSDINGGTITYSLTDDAGGLFAINASTGVVTVKNSLDYETATAHAITVRAADNSGLYTQQVFTIAVTDVAPSAPTDGNAAADSVSEGAVNGDLVGITAISADIHGGQVIYSLHDNAGGRFAIDSSTGVVSVLDASLLDFESNTSHSITVRAADPSGLYTDTVFTIAVTDVAPTQPVDANVGANTVVEGAANGTVVGVTGFATDIHGGTVSYALSADTSHGGFAIDSATGVVTVADAGKVDFESSGGSYVLTVRALDPSGAFTEQNFTIAVTDVAPVATGEAATTNEDTAIVVNAAQGLLINDTDINGAPLTAVLDAGPAHGTLTLNADGSFKYLSFQDYNGADSFTYHVSDGTLSSATVTVSLTIISVNDAPVLTAGNTLTFDANTGTPVQLSPGIALHDVDSTTMAGATVAISGGFEPADDTLDFTSQHGITGSFDRATGVLTLTGTASVADYQAALASVTFISTTQSDGTRSISWGINDGSAQFSQSVVTQTSLGVSGIIVPPPVFADNRTVTPTQVNAPAPLGFDTSRSNLLVPGDRNDGGYSGGASYGYQVVYTKPVLAMGSDADVQINLALGGLRDSLGGDVVYIIARQANGDPLPEWLAFDSVTGKFAGLPPDGLVASIQGYELDNGNDATGSLPQNPDLGLTPSSPPAVAKTITVEVLAKDSKGNIAVTTFVIELRPRTGKQGWYMDWNVLPTSDPRHAGLQSASPELAAIEAAVRDVTGTVEPFAIRGLPAPHGEPIVVGDAVTAVAPAGRAGLSEQMASIGWRAMTAQRNALLASLQQGR